MKNSLTTSQINFMIEAAIIICNITREEAILKVQNEIKTKNYSISLN